MILEEKIRNFRKESHREIILMTLFSLLFFLLTQNLYSQDSIPEKEDLTESAELKFQQYFFKALSQKSIGNHSKAIQFLENCNQILPEDKSVYFEFSKNYLALKKTDLAKEYINRALAKDSNNIWMLKHLVAIYRKDNDLGNAIDIQQKIVVINPKERENLVRLYLYNRNYKKAMDLLNTLEYENALSPNFRKLKASLEVRKGVVKKEEDSSDLASLIKKFDEQKSYETLKRILDLSNNDESVILKYSDIGIALYPAQSSLYLKKGKVLYNQKKYKEALNVLQNGIDFVIEEIMELEYFTLLSKVYKGLGNVEQEKKYFDKAKKLKS